MELRDVVERRSLAGLFSKPFVKEINQQLIFENDDQLTVKPKNSLMLYWFMKTTSVIYPQLNYPPPPRVTKGARICS